jgi:hypothetical protein
MVSRSLPSSHVPGRIYNTVVANKCLIWKLCRSPTLCRYWDTIIVANNRNRVSGEVLGLSQNGSFTDMFENLCVNSLKGDLTNDTTFNHFFLIGQYLISMQIRIKGAKPIRNHCRGIIIAPSHTKLKVQSPPPHGIIAHAWGAHICCSSVCISLFQRSSRHTS